MSIKYKVFAFLDSCDSKVISGWDLYDAVNPITGHRTYPSTLIDYAKEYADCTGATFECVNRAKSKYNFVQGFRMESAKISGRE